MHEGAAKQGGGGFGVGMPWWDAFSFCSNSIAAELPRAADVDVDSDDDMRGAKPVDWLPRGDFLLPEERRTLNDDRSDISDPEQGEQQSFLSKAGTRSKKASGFVLWKAKMSARYAAAYICIRQECIYK